MQDPTKRDLMAEFARDVLKLEYTNDVRRALRGFQAYAVRTAETAKLNSKNPEVQGTLQGLINTFQTF